MMALLIAVLAAVSVVWAPGVDAHSVKAAPAASTQIAGTPTSEPAAAPEPPPPAAAGRGLWMLASLAAVFGGACLARRLRRPTLALATAGLLVTLLAGSAPHLVHHAFEPGKAAECQVLQVASHADGALDTPDAPPIVMAAVRLDADPRLPARTVSAPISRTRAPPA